MITKVAFIAHPTKDLKRSMKFFRETLGMTETAVYGDHWAEYQAADGTTVAVDTFAPKFNEAAGPYLALETDDIAAEVERLKAAGVEILHEPWANTDKEDKEVCKMAFLRDPEGHSFMLHEIAPHRA